MTTPDRDLVELLRQRVRAARDGLGINTEHMWEALTALDAELSNVVDGPSDEPEAVAVARALLDTEHGAMRHHLWRVTPQGADPELTGTTFETADKAQELATSGGAVLYRRTVTYGPWRAVPGDGEAA